MTLKPTEPPCTDPSARWCDRGKPVRAYLCRSGASADRWPDRERADTRRMAKQDAPDKVIYSMVGVGKVYGQKQVLKDI
jgi:hypothetical protein